MVDGRSRLCNHALQQDPNVDMYWPNHPQSAAAVILQDMLDAVNALEVRTEEEGS